MLAGSVFWPPPGQASSRGRAWQARACGQRGQAHHPCYLRLGCAARGRRSSWGRQACLIHQQISCHAYRVARVPTGRRNGPMFGTCRNHLGHRTTGTPLSLAWLGCSPIPPHGPLPPSSRLRFRRDPVLGIFPTHAQPGQPGARSPAAASSMLNAGRACACACACPRWFWLWSDLGSIEASALEQGDSHHHHHRRHPAPACQTSCARVCRSLRRWT